MNNTQTTEIAIPSLAFAQLGLSNEILESVLSAGYEAPSGIQAEIIPLILANKDVIGQAQTGSGKTAAFAFPLLSKLDITHPRPQILVLTPTRELAIQVAEAFQKYAVRLPGFKVIPIYGGQDISIQLKHLKRGAHVVVGTPGRIIDHLKRKSLNLSSMKSFVLDEADEMLRMGFIDDVNTILASAPEKRQIALFSATMPKPIEKIANTYLHNPVHISMKHKTTICADITQRYCYIKHNDKIDGLTRLLETENFQAVLVFVKTKLDTVDLASKLQARGHAAEALSGDVRQAQRERIIDRLKKGSLDIVVATDVAARGIDVDRISHVINYDIPYDVESYIHRIGRTGRAGRKGDAILFVSPREKNMLYSIERATKQKIIEMHIPSIHNVNTKRVEVFKEKVAQILKGHSWEQYLEIINSISEEEEISTLEISAALCAMMHEKTPLFVNEKEKILTINEDEESFQGERKFRGNREGRSRGYRGNRSVNRRGSSSSKSNKGSLRSGGRSKKRSY